MSLHILHDRDFSREKQADLTNLTGMVKSPYERNILKPDVKQKINNK